MQPFFSIIIPTLNEEINLPILLDSISAQTERDFEVIVSDSGSKDGTKEKAEEYKSKITIFKLVEHQSKNVSQARNFGASQATGNFLVFFDADVEIEPNFFKDIKEKIQRYNLTATTVWNRDKTSGFSGRLMLGLLNISMDIFQIIKPVANGPCILIKKALFEKLKGFDDSIVFGEDFDLMQRAARLGMKFKVFKTPILYVSPRRFEKEGFLLSLYKSLKALVHQILIGPIRKPIFKYEMGGQEFKDK
jgi:glycosyltransferase involved in cell wall biosynthesis